MEEYSVYKHTSPSGKAYIGITKQSPIQRWRGGSGYSHQRYLSTAIKKYGWDNFKHEILFSGLTREEACSKEIELIKFYKSDQREYGYNIEGGGIQNIVSAETRQRLSDSHKGKKLTPEQKQKLREALVGHSNPHKGEPHSEEHRRKISEGLKGRVVTEKTRAKLRASNLGKANSLEARAKMSRSHTGLKPSFETVFRWKAANKALMVSVEQLNAKTNEVIACFASSMDAARSTGFDSSSIIKCCRGKRATAGGFGWRYATEARKIYTHKQEKKNGV